jgi:DNA-binding MarR family transcriptional regulator
MSEQPGRWTFLSNHAHVLVCLARDPELRLREVAEYVGITERAASSIVADLEAEGYLTRVKVGRRNTYKLHLRKPLRHPLEKTHRVGDLIAAVAVDE